ncbi:MAG: transketolase [Saprospiraceae bacterium]|jgi:transketolase
MADIKKLNRIATQVRRDIVRQVHSCQSGHPGGSLGCADLLVALYFEVMKHDTSFNMEGHGEDIFYLSNGHISPVFYSVLARSGYFPVEELATFRQLNSRLQGHPTTHEGLPGIRIASGSLGQGVSVGVGTALSKRMDKDDRTVYVLTGDGELQEGQNWEAFMSAAHYKLDNLVVIVDRNHVQIDGTNEDVMSLGDLEGKFSAFGFTTLQMEGNDMESVLDGLQKARDERGNGKPIVVIMDTKMGYGVDFMMDGHKWHGIAPNDEQLESAMSQLEETLGDY